MVSNTTVRSAQCIRCSLISVCIWRDIRVGSDPLTGLESFPGRRWLEIKANIFPREEELARGARPSNREWSNDDLRWTNTESVSPDDSHFSPFLSPPLHLPLSLSLSLPLDRLFLTLTSGPCWDETMRFPLCVRLYTSGICITRRCLVGERNLPCWLTRKRVSTLSRLNNCGHTSGCTCL